MEKFEGTLKEFKSIFPKWGEIEVGLCGWNYEEGGYLYANDGYGNMETYIPLAKVEEVKDYGLVEASFDNDEIVRFYYDL